MAKILLRSGYFDNFLALGENGQSIFDAALQIRETLRLRKLPMLVDCLAIPQANDSGDKVDWYAPHSGAVIPWATASIQQRQQALSYLENCLHTASQLSQRSLQAQKNSEQFFGVLLQNTFRFPGIQHVYLVNDKPVLTFWGFASLEEPLREDALDCLHASMQYDPEPTASEQPIINITPDIEAIIHDDPEPVIVTLSKPEAPTPVAAPLVVAPTPSAAPASTPWRKIRLPLASLVIFVALLLAWPEISYVMEKASKQLRGTSAFIVHPHEKDKRVIPVPQAVSLPLQQAKVNAPKEPVELIVPEKIVESPPEIPLPPPAKNALVLPADSVKAGTTEFLDGSWKITLEAPDGIKNTPSEMRFLVHNNTGQARVVLDKNIVCRAEIYSGLMQSGNLVIKPRSRAKCTDGNRYPLPELVCSQGLTGAAQCLANYEDGTAIPAVFKRVSN